MKKCSNIRKKYQLKSKILPSLNRSTNRKYILMSNIMWSNMISIINWFWIYLTIWKVSRTKG